MCLDPPVKHNAQLRALMTAAVKARLAIRVLTRHFLLNECQSQLGSCGSGCIVMTFAASQHSTLWKPVNLGLALLSTYVPVRLEALQTKNPM